jgi:hypothetical protein
MPRQPKRYHGIRHGVRSSYMPIDEQIVDTADGIYARGQFECASLSQAAAAGRGPPRTLSRARNGLAHAAQARVRVGLIRP